MQGVDVYKLALLAIAELVIFAGGAFLIVGGHSLEGILLIVVGTGITSALIVMLLLAAKREANHRSNE